MIFYRICMQNRTQKVKILIKLKLPPSRINRKKLFSQLFVVCGALSDTYLIEFSTSDAFGNNTFEVIKSRYFICQQNSPLIGGGGGKLWGDLSEQWHLTSLLRNMALACCDLLARIGKSGLRSNFKNGIYWITTTSSLLCLIHTI